MEEKRSEILKEKEKKRVTKREKKEKGRRD